MNKNLFLLILSVGLLHSQTLKDAVLKTQNERFEAAEEDFRKLIAKEPNNGEIYFYFAENYFLKGEVDSALYFYRKGTEVNASQPLNYVGLGKIDIMNGKAEDAKAKFYKATSISQNKNAEVFRKIAEAWIATPNKYPDEAINAANQAIKLDPKNEDGYIILGDALLEKNPADGSGPIKQYKQATTINPKSAKGIIREGKLYQRGRNYQLALDKYKEAEAIDNTFAPAYREKAELFFLAGQPAKSIENWKKYLELNNSPYARYRYMSALFNNKQYADAVKEYEDLKSKNFSNLYMDRIAGYAYAEMGDKTDKDAYAKGLKAINEFFSKAPANFKYLPTDYKYRSILYARNGNEADALTAMNKARELDPSIAADIYSDMAVVAYKNKNYQKVIELLENKKKESPAAMNNNDYFNLGRAAYNLGTAKLNEALNNKDKKKAIQQEAEAMPFLNLADTSFGSLIALNPNWPVAHIWKGRSLASIDYKNEKWLAKPSYEKVLNIIKPEEMNGTYKKEAVEAYEYLGFHYVTIKDKSKADEIWNKVKELDPENAKAKAYFNPKPQAGSNTPPKK
ncbi:MAG: tetratricopeptide repeat protein [Bacteroidia bacterium]|nr:tetratricopeptide repeat protein [Bacteroidia bacterium]